MVLSCFSHVSLLHLAANMYVLWSFSTSAVSLLGREQFLAVYLSAGELLPRSDWPSAPPPLIPPCPQASPPAWSATPVKRPPAGWGPRWEP